MGRVLGARYRRYVTSTSRYSNDATASEAEAKPSSGWTEMAARPIGEENGTKSLGARKSRPVSRVRNWGTRSPVEELVGYEVVGNQSAQAAIPGDWWAIVGRVVRSIPVL